MTIRFSLTANELADYSRYFLRYEKAGKKQMLVILCIPMVIIFGNLFFMFKNSISQGEDVAEALIVPIFAIICVAVALFWVAPKITFLDKWVFSMQMKNMKLLHENVSISLNDIGIEHSSQVSTSIYN